MGMKHAKFITTQFDGGMNVDDEEINLKQNESPDIQNMIVNADGSIETRNGFEELNSVASIGAKKCLGLFGVSFAGGADKGIVACFADGKVYKMENLDGTLDEIATGQSTTAKWSGVMWNNGTNSEEMLVIGNGSDAPLKIEDGSPWADSALGGSPPNLKYPAIFFDRLVYVDPTEPTRTRYTDVGTAETHAVINIIEHGFDITGIGVINGRCVVFGNNERDIVEYVGDIITPLKRTDMGLGVGCASHWSIVNTHQMLLWFDGHTVWGSPDGVKLEDVGKKLRKFFRDTCDFDKADDSSAVYYTKRKQYILACQSEAGSIPDRMAVIDFSSGTSYVYDGMDASAQAIVFDNNGDSFHLFGSAANDGDVYKADNGTDDNDTAIDAYIVTAPLRFDTLREKRIRYINIHTDSVTTDYYIDLQYRESIGGAWSPVQSVNIYQGGNVLDTFVLDVDTLGATGELKKKEWLHKVRGDFIQFRVRNNMLNQPFKIRKIDVVLQTGRVL